MSFKIERTKSSITFGGVDLSQYIRSAIITTSPSFSTSQLGTIRYLPDEPLEPAKLSDCPHKPGTIEHRDWIRTHVLDRQTDPRTEANREERARIQGLTQDRRVQMENDRERRAAEIDAMIADLPEPNVDIPPDPAPWITEGIPWKAISGEMVRSGSISLDPSFRYDFLRDIHYPIVKYDLDAFTKITDV